MSPTAGSSVFGAIRRGDFLDRARVRRIAVIVLAVSVIAFAGLIATARGGVDLQGRPLGPDFFSFWSAARIAEADGAAAAYDVFRHRAFQSDFLEGRSEFHAPFWSAPQFLLLASAFAVLPFAASWTAFSGLSFAGYFAAMRRLAPRGPLSTLLIVAAPGVLANVSLGQSGLLLASLFTAGALYFRTRPLVAGVCIGLIALKPQYGILIPFCLIIAGRWRVLAAAAATVLAQAALATIAFGASIWTAFIANGVAANFVLLESGAVRWEKNASVYAAFRRYGAASEFAYLAHGAVVAAIAISLFALWRSRADPRLKLAALIVAALIAPPYVLDYDLIILAPAIALVVSCAADKGFKAFEKLALAFAWAAPAAIFVLTVALRLPFGPMTLLSLYAVILARARNPLPLFPINRSTA